MRIRSLFLCPNHGDLDQPAEGATTRWTARRGLWVGLHDTEGRLGQGEASPLPGYSSDTLEACEAALRQLDPSDVGDLCAESLRHPPPALASLPSAARFAIETAAVDLIAQAAGQPAWRVLRDAAGRAAAVDRPIAGEDVPLAALLQGREAPALAAEAAQARRRGIRTVKLKVDGSRPLRELVGCAAAVRDEIGPALAIRLDAGGSLPPERAAAALDALSAVNPELIEEPVPYEALPRLEHPAVPVALDESLQRPAAWEALEPWLTSMRCCAVVLKPAALGGLFACLDLAERARARSISVIVSHLFDGPIGLAAAAHLALAVATPEVASGLDRHRGLTAWPEVELPLVKSSRLEPVTDPGLGIAPLFSA